MTSENFRDVPKVKESRGNIIIITGLYTMLCTLHITNAIPDCHSILTLYLHFDSSGLRIRSCFKGFDGVLELESMRYKLLHVDEAALD